MSTHVSLRSNYGDFIVENKINFPNFRDPSSRICPTQGDLANIDVLSSPSSIRICHVDINVDIFQAREVPQDEF